MNFVRVERYSDNVENNFSERRNKQRSEETKLNNTDKYETTEKEEKRGTRSFLPQNDAKNVTLDKNNQIGLSLLTKNILNYQGPFKQKVDNLLVIPEEQFFRLPDQDLNVLLLYVLDTYQEQDKLLNGRKAQLK